MTVDPEQTAALLDAAHRDRRTLEAADVEVGDLASAYAVQRALTAIRLARGDSVIGWKLGYTTAAMREQMGIDAPNFGPLLASMRIDDVLPPTLTQPRVEPEIALVLERDPGTGADADRVLASCARARLALEVVDSAWTAYRFDLEHNTADGSSAAGFVLGEDLPLAAGTFLGAFASAWTRGNCWTAGSVPERSWSAIRSLLRSVAISRRFQQHCFAARRDSRANPGRWSVRRGGGVRRRSAPGGRCCG